MSGPDVDALVADVRRGFRGYATSDDFKVAAVALDSLAALARSAADMEHALLAIRDTAKWYGKGERLQHEVHHALVVEVYDVADRALEAAARSREQQEGT